MQCKRTRVPHAPEQSTSLNRFRWRHKVMVNNLVRETELHEFLTLGQNHIQLSSLSCMLRSANFLDFLERGYQALLVRVPHHYSILKVRYIS